MNDNTTGYIDRLTLYYSIFFQTSRGRIRLLSSNQQTFVFFPKTA